jgi:hypothetical protein
VTHNSGLLPDELSAGEDGEVRNAAYGETCRERLVPISVDLKDEGLTRHVLRRARDLWGGGATRTAPVSPKIHQDGNARVLDDFIEEGSVHLQGFVEWRQRVFARAATASVRQVTSRNAIFLAAGFARSYHRHLFSPPDWIHLACFGCVASIAEVNRHVRHAEAAR